MVTAQETKLVYPSLVTPTARSEESKTSRRGKGRKPTDTLTSAKKLSETLKGPADRIALPPSKGGDNKAYLKILAEAFSRAYSAEEKGVKFQTTNLAKLQQLDQTMAKGVLDTTTIAIKKEKAELVKEEQIQQEQAEAQQKSSEASGILKYLGIALIVVTVLSSVLDFGASLALVPEEVGAEAGGEAAGDAATESTDSAAQAGTEGTEMTTSAASEATEGTNTAIDEGTTSINNSTEVAEDTTNTSQSGLKEGLKSAAKTWKDFRAKPPMLGKWGSRFLKLAIGGGFATPQFMNSYAEFKISKYQRDLAKAQSSVGTQLAQCNLEGSILQYFQQLAGRSQGLDINLVQQLGNTIEVAGNTMNAYRQISAGMAQAKRG